MDMKVGVETEISRPPARSRLRARIAESRRCFFLKPRPRRSGRPATDRPNVDYRGRCSSL